MDNYSIYLQVKESYKTVIVIVCIAVLIQQSFRIPLEIFQSSVVTSTAIMALPLAVALACFATSRAYGGSKVFGKSYFLLGLSYIAFFAGEALYYFYMDVQEDYTYSVVADVFFMVSMPLLLAHIIINIRYFTTGLEAYQKAILVTVPTIAFSGYLLVLGANPQGLDWNPFNFILVAESVLVLGFTVVAFTIFRQTVLFGPWFLLLIGIMLSTAGDIMYHYTDIVSLYDFADPTTGLWLASSMIVIYALYSHQKSI